MVKAKSNIKKKSNSHTKKFTKKSVTKKKPVKKSISEAVKKKITKKKSIKKKVVKKQTSKKITKTKSIKRIKSKSTPKKKVIQKNQIKKTKAKKKIIKKILKPKISHFKVSEGDIIQLEIVETVENEGICQYKEFLFFVKGATKGDVVTAKITKIIGKICFAEPNNPKQKNQEDMQIPDLPEMDNSKIYQQPKFKEVQDLEIPDLPDLQ